MYHHSTDGQAVVLDRRLPLGTYFIVSVANPDCDFSESSFTDNVSFLGFDLADDAGSPGNRKLKVRMDLRSNTCCHDNDSNGSEDYNERMCGVDNNSR